MSTVDKMYKETIRQRRDIGATIENASSLNQAAQNQTITSINLRFEHILQVIRGLQKQVNKLSPEEIKQRLDEIISIDPLVPKADKFEKRLEDLDKNLRASEVIFFLRHYMQLCTVKTLQFFRRNLRTHHPGQSLRINSRTI